ncbi:MAG: DnaB-like helicase C-terminal domain-containing protein, partial [Candidatus Caldarchaeum sp.]
MRTLIDSLHYCDHTAEEGVIGCLLSDPARSIPFVLEAGVQSHDFFDPRHAIIFQCLTKTEPLYLVDFVSAVSCLEKSGVLPKAGGYTYLNKLADSIPSVANLSHYIELLFDASKARALAVVCIETLSQLASKGNTPESLLASAQSRLIQIQSRFSSTSSGDVRSLITSIADDLILGRAPSFHSDALPSGFPDLDRLTGGLVPGQMTVPAGFPGTGKTTLLLNMALCASRQHPCVFFSLEMPRQWLLERLFTIYTALPRAQLQQNTDAVRSTAEFFLSENLILIDDVHDIASLSGAARRFIVERGVRAIFVDYIQLLTDQSSRHESREQEVSQIARKLKLLALELKLAVVAPSQVNDEGLLRESRAIGQHADVVLQLELAGSESDEIRSLLCRIKKNRFGPTGTPVHLTFLPQTGRIANTTVTHE